MATTYGTPAAALTTGQIERFIELTERGIAIRLDTIAEAAGRPGDECAAWHAEQAAKGIERCRARLDELRAELARRQSPPLASTRREPSRQVA